MTPTSVHDIRNVALLGHSGGGKTTLLEALLVASGTIGAAGSIERGDTVSDFDAQEKAMGHSLATSIAHFEWAGHWVNMLDTPGLPDLAGRALSALPAVETAAVVVSAQAGIESGTRRMMDAAADKCRLIVVSKIDAASTADLTTLMEKLTATFGRECLPVNLPAADRARVIDCFFSPDHGTETAFSSVTAGHEAIIDQVVELDEALMASYLEQGESLDPEQLHAPFEQALREGHLIPVCFVSSRTGAGVNELLDILGRLMPDPTEGNPPRFVKGEGSQAQPVEVAPDPTRHVIAHVFQVANDPYRGKLGLFRIHQGTLGPNSQLYIGDSRKSFKVAHLLRLQGKNQVETPVGVPGDICAVARVDDIHPDAVLHDSHDEDTYHLAATRYPQPVFGLALITRKHGDEQKLAEALTRLVDEDPCLEVGFDPQARQTVIRGLGELHLKIVLEQLRTRWNLQLDTATPTVPYRETIAATAEARYRHKKQSGGAGQFGEVALRVEALPRGSGIELGNEVKGGAIPTNFLPAVEKGVRQALAEGASSGFPVQDVRVVLTDGKHHAVDSNEISFVTAGRHATLEALLAARPIVLEPLVTVTVKVEDSHFGDITAEFAARRGRLTATESPASGWTVLTATVPMAEMEGFEARLKAICAGESEFVLVASGHEPAPQEVQQRLTKLHAERSSGQ
ncbi:elongation factor G [Aromatoleum aromaticum]|uniref:Elongation factor G n=1 Tax=Aromatoleum aromaticum (strain DSM 19018 / LMG 30748 / EbN1) TaxID=76114 RepID=Q5P806_AROAE|nr:elongation factor G [Aromatoleum aromaticum]NMG55961.1 elongation factor G [Aromatoleum aromaticum]CAI06555.1 translation elongation factor G [Aromatoleum aromaticum EbN1]